MGHPNANLSWYELGTDMVEITGNDSSNGGWFLTNKSAVQWGGGYTSSKLMFRVSYLVDSQFEKIIERNVTVVVGGKTHSQTAKTLLKLHVNQC